MHNVGGLFALFFFLFAKCGFFSGSLGFFSQKTFTVFFGDLIIVRMDFGKSQESMAIAAIIDESRLKRRFDPGYFCEIDIAFELLVLGRFKIKLLNPVSCYDCDPGFFPVTRVDEHTRGH